MMFLPQHMNHVLLLFEVIATVLSTTDLAWMSPTVDAVFVRMDNWMIPLVSMAAAVCSLLQEVGKSQRVATTMAQNTVVEKYFQLMNAIHASV